MALFISLSLSLLVAMGDTSPLIAADVIRAGDLVTQSNVTTESGQVTPDEPLIGREVARTIYAGRAITFENTRPARLVKRNQIVTLKYLSGVLEITTTGRAMGDASLADPVSVLNLQSRQQVQGIVQHGGWVLVQ